eukprot:3553398-Rhodomonas_salina.1
MMTLAARSSAGYMCTVTTSTSTTPTTLYCMLNSLKRADPSCFRQVDGGPPSRAKFFQLAPTAKSIQN